MKLKFFKCRHCGNVVAKFVDSGVSLICCGTAMSELHPETMDEGLEKHLPMMRQSSAHTYEVTVGSTPHPMAPGHRIQFIAVETERGFTMQWLDAETMPKATFCCCEPPKAVYAYCNIHGLWRLDV